MAISSEHIKACKEAALEIVKSYPGKNGLPTRSNSVRVDSLFSNCIEKASKPEVIQDGWIYAHPEMTFLLALFILVLIYYIAKMIILRKNNVK